MSLLRIPAPNGCALMDAGIRSARIGGDIEAFCFGSADRSNNLLLLGREELFSSRARDISLSPISFLGC